MRFSTKKDKKSLQKLHVFLTTNKNTFPHLNMTPKSPSNHITPRSNLPNPFYHIHLHMLHMLRTHLQKPA